MVLANGGRRGYNGGRRDVEGMKCEYCDSLLRVAPDNGVCPNCGAVLPQEPSGTDRQEPVDVGSYFQRYQPDRVKAIKALRADTGMRLTEAKILIDRYFDEHLSAFHGSELAEAGRNLLNAIKEVRAKGK